MTPQKKGGDHFADQEFLKLMDVISDGIAVYEARKGGKEFIIRDFNRAAERIEKIKRSEVVGRSVVDAFPGIKEMGLLPVFERVWRTGAPEKYPVITYKDERISGWRENTVMKLKSGLIVAVYQDMTAIKREQAEAKYAKNELEATINAMTDPVVTTDLSFRVTSANTAARNRLKDLGIVDPIGKSIFRVAPIIDKKTARQDYENIVRTKKGVEREVVYNIDGRLLYSKTKRIPIILDGEIKGILSILNDFTKEKMAEVALRESLKRLSYIADVAGEMIWESDMRGVMTYLSPAAERFLGYSSEEVVGKKRYADLLDPSIKENTERLLKKCYAERQKFHDVTVLARKKSGEKVILQLNGAPIFDEEGVAMGYVGMSEDVTDIRNYEENLRKFQLAVENASDHIIITDAEGVILYANKAACNTTGYEVKEMIGRTPALWGKQMPVEFYKEMWHRIKDLKETFVGEIKNRRKNGEVYIAEARISPILDDSGKVSFFVGIERDVTKAKEVDRVKTEFVSLASHQLRTPLSIINWYTEMLLGGDKGELSESQKSYVEEIHRSNHRMIELVNSLLNASRIDMGTLMIAPKPVNLSEVSDIVISELTPQIRKKGTIIKKDYDSLPTIQADPELVRIIFQNLISNAVKYTGEKGEVAVTMRKDKAVIRISVSDNGCGIPADQQSKIFTKLFRADNARVIDPDGNGLGLYIVKSIMDASGGSISFVSEESKGTRFDVVLPISGMKPKEGAKNLI